MKKIKNKYPLIMARTNQMIDLEEFSRKEPKLFAELAHDYPMEDKIIYMIKVENV